MIVYGDLREELRTIFADYLERENYCLQGGEFDYEFEEVTIDRILRIIRERGGTY